MMIYLIYDLYQTTVVAMWTHLTAKNMNECIVYVNRVWPAFGVMAGTILHIDFLHTVLVAVILNVAFLIVSVEIYRCCLFLFHGYYD